LKSIPFIFARCTSGRSILRRAAWAVVFTLSACQAEIQHGLTEGEANEIVVLLERARIPAAKLLEEGGREVTWKIAVPKAQTANAMILLKENELPRLKSPGLEIFNRGSMIPTATEERAMFLQALSGELSRTLSSVDGVLETRVHINLPQSDDLSDKTVKPKPGASIFMKYRWVPNPEQPDQKPFPPISEDKVQALVARAVQDLEPSSVTVVTAAAKPPNVEGTPTNVTIAGIQMTEESTGKFYLLFTVMLVVILGLIGYLVYLTLFRSRKVAAPPT
jgi:type III secretion protein J